MTEPEWLSSTDPIPLLKRVGGRRNERKLRLFAVACCRRMTFLADDEVSQKALTLAELFADGQLAKPQRRNAYESVAWGHRRSRVMWALAKVATQAATWSSHTSANGVAQSAVARQFSQPPVELIPERESLRKQVRAVELQAQVRILHDIFGNPFRPVALDPRWLTDPVVALASGIDAEKAFDRMPVLADALEESGCSEFDILNHCRGDDSHVRGCWVVDLMLGKS